VTRVATEADAPALAALRNAAADRLARDHGDGHWSHHATERSVLRGLETSRVLVIRNADGIIGTLRLTTRKPWAIDPSYFTKVKRALYLLDMAVAPESQGRGIGRQLLVEAEAVARAWPANSIRLDAYDAPAGAGAFYARCGFREVGRVAYRGVPLIYYERLLEIPGAGCP